MVGLQWGVGLGGVTVSCMVFQDCFLGLELWVGE